MKRQPIVGLAWTLSGVIALVIAAPVAAKTKAPAVAPKAAAAAESSTAASAEPWPTTNKGLWPIGVFEKENLEKPRPPAPWNITRTWRVKNDPADGGVDFLPLPKFKPNAQRIYDEHLKALADHKAYQDDTGQCWPYGMPKWLTRGWGIQFMQFPTVIVAVQGLFNSVRQIYLDGRGHIDPDLIEPTYNGDSVARWEGDTLVIDTTGFDAKRHWITNGVTMSNQLHIIERIKMAPDRESFTNQITMIDPVNWEGEWKNTKTYVPVKAEDVSESKCLPDLDDNIVGTFKDNQVR